MSNVSTNSLDMFIPSAQQLIENAITTEITKDYSYRTSSITTQARIKADQNQAREYNNIQQTQKIANRLILQINQNALYASIQIENNNSIPSSLRRTDSNIHFQGNCAFKALHHAISCG